MYVNWHEKMCLFCGTTILEYHSAGRTLLFFFFQEKKPLMDLKKIESGDLFLLVLFLE